MKPTTLKLAPEYECFPIWLQTQTESENVDVQSLPISGDLKERIAMWDAEYQATYNRSDPMKSGFESRALENRWDMEGVELVSALKAELDDSFSIVYYREIVSSEPKSD